MMKEVAFVLMVCDNVLLKGNRVIVPPKHTQRVIELTHESNRLGETHTIRYLRERV